MKKIIIILALTYLLNSCCDCSTNPKNNTDFECMVRESSITEFNADLLKIDTILKPGAYYSIHSFLFPENDNISGTLVNDERFAKSGEVLVALQSFNQPYKIAILDNNPINSNMIGDILVDTVYGLVPSADLKFKGDLARIDSNFLFDDAELFCDYIKQNTNFINQNIINLSKYGVNSSGSAIPKLFSNLDIRILNGQNENVTGQTGIPTPSIDDINSLLDKVNTENVVIRVKPGDIFIYRSISGKLFVVLIADVRNGLLQPNKGRVTIMFSKIG